MKSVCASRQSTKLTRVSRDECSEDRSTRQPLTVTSRIVDSVSIVPVRRLVSMLTRITLARRAWRLAMLHPCSRLSMMLS